MIIFLIKLTIYYIRFVNVPSERDKNIEICQCFFQKIMIAHEHLLVVVIRVVFDFVNSFACI